MQHLLYRAVAPDMTGTAIMPTRPGGRAHWQAERRYVNNLALDEAADAAAFYGPKRYQRLAARTGPRVRNLVLHDPVNGAAIRVSGTRQPR